MQRGSAPVTGRQNAGSTIAVVVATTSSSSSSGGCSIDEEHEAVELRLGQRIGAFLLDRVLRRQHEERLGSSLWSCPPTVTRCSCIASSMAACVFGGVRLISSASTMLAKIGPALKHQLRRPVAGVLLNDFRAR